MFDFIIRKPKINGAQKFINKLEPSVNIHLHSEIPLPAVKEIKKYAQRVSRINVLEESIMQLSDDQLKAKTQEFQAKIKEQTQMQLKQWQEAHDKYTQAGTNAQRVDLAQIMKEKEQALFEAKQKVLDEILEEAFAVVRETGKRVLNMRHYDVQLVGGMVLHFGNIAEMTTGEGKTLVATLPTYLNALTGDGVHVITVNDYLAERDCDWMGQIYKFLGLSVGVILHNMGPQERQENYGADITYGTNNEFGFDYLRDNMVSFKEDMVQRPHHFAVVDEVDSILVDEARTPLIISGPTDESTDKYYLANRVVKQLKGRRITEGEEIEAKHRGEDLSIGFDYVADEKAKSIALTEAGEEKAAQAFGIKNLHDMDTIEYRHHILQALKAHEFFMRDTDYVVQEDKVVIVDEFTGRMMPGRRWSDGLHQAVEAKEGITIEKENQTLATITFQNYFRMYQKLSGMTGTAYTEATEFKQIYELDVVTVPTNKPLARLNHPDCIYRTAQEKYEAAVEEITEMHKLGRPVLVGTISIERSELLSTLLKGKGIKHQVLNAKFHEQEANIISQAGRLGAVTIATNMAGRGTDIVLGGNAEYLARQLAHEKGHEGDEAEETVTKFISQFEEQVKKEHQQVVEAGGLHVLGTERHESRRIDNQLRGRSGRQGDPGGSRFYVSLEDDLMRLFGENVNLMKTAMGNLDGGSAIESGMVSRALEVAQRRVEGFNFEIRKQLLEYDNVMNKQREVVYNLRRSIIEGQNTKDFILEAVDIVVEDAVAQYLFINVNEEGEWDWDGFVVYFKAKFDYDLTKSEDEIKEMSQQDIHRMIYDDLLKAYAQKEEDMGEEHLRHLERMFLLHTIDSKWKDHLYAMDQLKEGVGLRSYGQRDPLIEYKREGFGMFKEMYESIDIQVAEMIFKVQPAAQQERMRGVFDEVPQQMVHQKFTGLNAPQGAPSPQAPTQIPTPESKPTVSTVRREGEKVGRNDPCPCGSGKKYKKCCGQ